MGGLLSGVRVLALEQILAGPFGSMLLGDLGAEVIKVEPPGGEASRGQAGPRYKGESSYYLAFSRNKKSIVLDLRTPSGKEAFSDLVKLSDVVLDNYRPGVMERLGLDYDSLKKINPKIICCSITGYGSSGPYKDLPSYDIIAQGMSGILSVTGEPGGPPIKTGPSIADISGGMYGALGVCAALVAREKTGTGQRIDVSLLDAAVSLLAFHFSWYFISGEVPGPVGSKHIQTTPFGAYKAKDAWITLGASWPQIARTLGVEWMIDDPRFSTSDARLQHREEVDRIITEELGKMNAKDWLEILQKDDIPANLVYTIDKAAIDPQILHNKMILTMEHPLGGEIKLTGQPVKAPGSIREEEFTAPPTLGQHTHEVLTELLHYSDEKIRRIKEEEKEGAAELKKHLRKRF